MADPRQVIMSAGKKAYQPAANIALPRNVRRATDIRNQYPTKKLKFPSTVPISCVHRVIIRPIGVVSNHLNVAENMLPSKLWCIVRKAAREFMDQMIFAEASVTKLQRMMRP